MAKTAATALVQPVSSLEGTQVMEDLTEEPHCAVYVTPYDRHQASKKAALLSPSFHAPHPDQLKPSLHQLSILKGTDSHCCCLAFPLQPPLSVIALQEGCVKWKVINHRGHAEKELLQDTQ